MLIRQKHTFQAILVVLASIILLTNKLEAQDIEIKDDFTFLRNNIYLFRNNGSNLTISYGKDGLLIVDAGKSSNTNFNYNLITKNFNAEIKYIINTHYHFEMVGGNDRLSQNGATIIAHKNTRRMMEGEWEPPKIHGMSSNKRKYKDSHMPDIIFSDSLIIYWNFDEIQLVYLPGGHSNSDVLVKFTDANIIHASDLFVPNSFPPFEGSFDEYLSQVESIIKRSDDKTIIVPSQGSPANKEGIINYRDRIIIGAHRVDSLKDFGRNFLEIVEMDPLQDLLQEKPTIPNDVFIFCVYYNN